MVKQGKSLIGEIWVKKILEGGIVQLVRTAESYSEGRGFKSLFRYKGSQQ